MTAREAFDRHMEDIQFMIKVMNGCLADHAGVFGFNECDWSYVASLSEIREQLIKTLSFVPIMENPDHKAGA